MNIRNNADVLMSTAAIGGFITTLYFTIKKTPEAYFRVLDTKEKIDAIKQEQNEKGWDKATVNRTIAEEKLCLAKDISLIYAPAIVSGGVTIGCIIAANKAGRNKNALMTSAINAGNVLIEECRAKAKDVVGPKKSDEIISAINEDHVKRAPEPIMEKIALTGRGDILCAMEIEPGNPDTMIFFRSSPQAVESARNELNSYLIESGVVTQEDMLYFLGIRLHGHGTDIRRRHFTNGGSLIRFRPDTFIYEKTKEPVLFIEVVGGWEYS